MRFSSRWIFLAVVLGGCALSAPPPRNGRFEVDITELQKSDRYKNTWIYRNPTKSVTAYPKCLVPPVSVYDNPVHAIKERAPFDAMARRFTERMRELMRKDYQVVDSTGADVLNIQVSVVDIKPVVAMKDAAGNAVIRTDTTAKGSKIEIDCHDSVTGEQIFAMSTLYPGERYTAYLDPTLAPALERAFNDWSAYFRDRLDDAIRRKKAAATRRR